MAYHAKRQFSRKNIREGIRIRTERGVEFATFEDFSSGGMRIWMDREIKVNEVVDLDFRLPATADLPSIRINCLARVVRCQALESGRYNVGVSFVSLEPAVKDHIHSRAEIQPSSN